MFGEWPSRLDGLVRGKQRQAGTPTPTMGPDAGQRGPWGWPKQSPPSGPGSEGLTVECFQYRMISGMFSTGCRR